MQKFWNILLDLFSRASEIWIAGGWAMAAIAVVGLVMFGIGMHTYMKMWGSGFFSVPERRWRRWIVQPSERYGAVGRVLNEALASKTLEDIANVFQGVRTTELAPFHRDLRVMKVCVAAAPLLGLFGTVTGMLTTFSALATGSGGEKTMAMIAGGISEALITTETGLIIALPGLFFQYQLTRRYERLKAFFAHLETVCTQHLYKELRATESPRSQQQRTIAVKPTLVPA